MFDDAKSKRITGAHLLPQVRRQAELGLTGLHVSHTVDEGTGHYDTDWQMFLIMGQCAVKQTDGNAQQKQPAPSIQLTLKIVNFSFLTLQDGYQ